MEFVEPGPELRARLDRARDEVDARIIRCGLPLFGLADPAPTPRMLMESNADGETVEQIALGYGDPERADGPLVQVHTARWGRHSTPLTLVDLVEREFDRIGDGADVPDRTERAELVVDGVAHAATLLPAGARFWAAQCVRAGIEITVVARDWDLAVTRLIRVAAVEPFLRARADYLDACRAAEPPLPEPADAAADTAYPHRELIDAVLEQHRHLRDRMRAGRRPRVHDAQRIGALWQATRIAQARLTDQSPERARDAVTALVNQLSQLDDDAEWFADPRLREPAIAETLMYWTELRLEVPSRPAQEAWRRYWWSRRALGPADLRVRPWAAHSRVREFSRLGRDWLDAWEAWARTKF